MNEAPLCEFRPVLRRPRQEWIIPAIAVDRGSGKEPELVTQLPDLALWEGTTAQGREILRKILFFIKTRIENQEDTAQVIGQAEARLNGFSEILPELTGIFLRLCGRVNSPPEGLTAHVLATLMVFRVRLERARYIATANGTTTKPAVLTRTGI